MLIPKVFLSRNINNEELYEIVKDGLGIGKVRDIRKSLNNVEVMTKWSRFELRLNGKELSIHQRWSKDKIFIVIGLVLLSLIIWVPFLFIAYKMYQERKISKEILDKLGARINI